ncbi:hypothetical protein ABR737_01450 [Streptomyces sp. Edi2]|uniref:hypothetical protein n=1 Tax=Streptomyces sp. Edi2 TaxID=3162528 RepID=UPI0033066A69
MEIPLTSSHDLEQAFADLPSSITRKEIASAARRPEEGVQDWIDAYDDFPPVVGRRGNHPCRDRDGVLAWLLDHPHLFTEKRRGPQDIAQRARAASPELLVTVKGLADALGLAREAVQYYTATFTPEKTTDPFPPAARQGRTTVRSWPAVRSWLLRRNDPLPSGELRWPELRSWLLAVYEQEKDEPVQLHDEHGLSLAQRDVVERVRVAVASGHSVHAQWASEVPGLNRAKAAAALSAGAGPVLSQRLAPTALARELGISIGSLRGFERRYPDWCRDPFPAKDGSGARDVEEVRAWLRRGDLLPASEDAP